MRSSRLLVLVASLLFASSAHAQLPLLGAGYSGLPSFVVNPTNLSVAVVGDSRANAGLSNTANDKKFKNLGSVNWVAQSLGQRFIRSIGDYGVGGGTTASTLALFPGYLASDTSSFWRWISGGNDITLGTSLASIQASYREAAATAYSAHRILIVGEYPFSTAAMTGPQQTTQAQLAQWLAQVFPLEYRNVIYSGSWNATAATPGYVATDPASGVSYDGKHLFSYGAWLAANGGETAAFAAIFTNTTSQYPLVDNATVAYDAATAPFGSLVSNWFLTGTAPAAPTGWTLTTLSGVTTAVTYGTDANGFNEVILSLSGTPASSGFINLNQTIPAASILEGNVIRCAARVVLNAGSTGISAVATESRFVDGTPTTTLRDDLDSGGATLSGSPNVLDLANFDGPTLNPPTQSLAAGATYSARSVRLYVYFVASVVVSATVRFGRVTCHKI